MIRLESRLHLTGVYIALPVRGILHFTPPGNIVVMGERFFLAGTWRGDFGGMTEKGNSDGYELFLNNKIRELLE